MRYLSWCQNPIPSVWSLKNHKSPDANFVRRMENIALIHVLLEYEQYRF
jgi:hypothetical protein